MLHTLASQALTLPGNFMECGVYRGGMASMFAQMIADSGTGKKLYLFDTFAGMPQTHAVKDFHVAGEFADTSAESVAAFVGHPDVAILRKGFVPDTFKGVEDQVFAFGHIDLDIYQSIQDATRFLWPRLSRGGFIIYDDYGFRSCPGAREAVDEFFAGTGAKPLAMVTGQAVVFKS